VGVFTIEKANHFFTFVIPCFVFFTFSDCTVTKSLFQFKPTRGHLLCQTSYIIRAVTGFVSYSLVRTTDGGVSVTVCQHKAGTDESLQLAKEWVQEHGSNLNASPPTVTEGVNILQLS
jgi:hypothetical protein